MMAHLQKVGLLLYEIKPKTTNTLDIGTNSLLFKDMFLDGVATIGSIKIDNAGTIGSASDGDAIAISSGGVVTFSQNTIGKTGSGYVLALQTSDTTIEATNVLGKIEFSAPDEASGTDAILVGASIEALAEATFDSSTNSTALVFKTNTTGAATERMRLTSAGDLHFLDNRKAIFGAGSDLQIYHDGSNSYIQDTGTGALGIFGSTFVGLYETVTGDKMVIANGGSDVELYYDNALKLATTSTGIAITGGATFSGTSNFGDGNELRFGADNDLAIFHSSGVNNIRSDAGTLKLRSDDMRFTAQNGTSEFARFDSSGKLGIGTSSPSASLTIGYSGAEAQIQVNNSGGDRMVYLGAFSANEGILRLFNSSNVETVRIPSESTAGVHTYFNAGNVGIGTDSPSELIELSAESDPRIRINNSDISLTANQIIGGLEFYTNDPSSGGTGIGASIDAYAQGNFGSNQQGLYLTFSTRDSGSGETNTERMRIDSSGNLLVGKSVNDNTTEGAVIRETGEASFATTSNRAAIFNRLTTDGEIIGIRKDGSTVGSIGTTAGELTIGSADTALRFTDAADRIDPWSVTSNGARDATIDFGTGARRFKDLYLSGGVYLGGTGSANKLDDYEEGTFDPQIFVGETRQTLLRDAGYYVKVGNLVHCSMAIIVNGAISGSGSVSIRNFPYNSLGGDGGNARAAGSIGYTDGTFMPAGILMGSNNGRADMFCNSTPGTTGTALSTSLQGSDLPSSWNMHFSVTYVTY